MTAPTPPTPPRLTDDAPGGRVVLRALEESDVEGCYEQCVDPRSIRWTTVPDPYTRADARQFCLEVAPAAWADGSQWILAVEHEGRYAGNIALRDEGTGRLEVAYGAHPAARGTGAMTRGVRMLLDWGFAAQGARTIVWRANVGNWASRKLAWRLGFTVEGTLRRYQPHRGELVDCWVGTLLPTDPREPQAPWLGSPVLEAEGLRLRPVGAADLPRVQEAGSDERTAYWLSRTPRPYRPEDAVAWLESISAHQAEGTGTTWAVVDPTDDELLAAIEVFDLQAGESCEIGFWTHPGARGRGVMTRAVRAVVGHALSGLGVQRVQAHAGVDNAASRHVLTSAGLREQNLARRGTTTRDGVADAVRYDVLAEEWPSR